MPGWQAAQVTVVIATHNRVADLCRTLDQLGSLSPPPPVIVVDNASADQTPRAVAGLYPDVRLVTLPRNVGVAARNVGVLLAATPFVAFCDDDSWWRPGSLATAVKVLAAYPRIGVIAARTLVGPAASDDPVNAAMRDSPLRDGELPGPQVLGFLACAAVVRREAFLQAGGFSELLMIGGEEALLAMDLAAAGWAAVYLDDVVAEHWPSAARQPSWRHMLDLRNEVLIAWLRRPVSVAMRQTLALLAGAVSDPAAARSVSGVIGSLPQVLVQRRRLPADIEQRLRLISAAAPAAAGARTAEEQRAAGL